MFSELNAVRFLTGILFQVSTIVSSPFLAHKQSMVLILEPSFLKGNFIFKCHLYSRSSCLLANVFYFI